MSALGVLGFLDKRERSKRRYEMMVLDEVVQPRVIRRVRIAFGTDNKCAGEAWPVASGRSAPR